MADIEDRLAPRDGLNTYNILLARMELPTHGSAQFTFAVTASMLPVAELHVSVPAVGQSLDRMTVEAHDAMIDILRQLLFRAEKARRFHDRNAERGGRVPAPSVTAMPDFVMERRTGTDRRGGSAQDHGFTDFAAAEAAEMDQSLGQP